MAKAGNVVRANPDGFSKYVGETLTYTHADYGDQTLRVSGIAHYDRVDGEGKAAFALEHVGIQATTAPSTTDGSYIGSIMNQMVSGDFYDGMPQNIKDVMNQVKVPCWSENNVIKREPLYVFLLSESEVTGSTSHASEGSILDYYEGAESGGRVKKYNGNNSGWWLRTRNKGTSNSWVYVTNNGSISTAGQGTTYGISPIFNVG